MKVQSQQCEQREADGRVKGTTQAGTAEGSQGPLGKIGHTPFIRVRGAVPACGFTGAKLLGQRSFVKGGASRLGCALYVLRDGSFCSVTGHTALVIPANQIRSYLDQEGCPWDFTPTRYALLMRLVREHDGNAKPYVC